MFKVFDDGKPLSVATIAPLWFKIIPSQAIFLAS